MESKIVKYDMSKLNKFVKGISEKHILKVGIMGGKNSRKEEGLSNAEIGAKHEFGSFSEGIQKRSFLRMPLFVKMNEILKQMTNKNVVQAIEAGKIVSVLKHLGIACENVIQKAFESGGFGSWARLSKITIARKNSSAILIETAQMRRSISSKVE